MRLRIHFAKTEAMRYTSHLDLHRAWERTIRRANLPLAYTQGYRPHPRINLASALPLGFTSQDEVVDIWLEETLPVSQIEADLEKSLPPGIQLQAVQTVRDQEPALQTQVKSSEYRITLLEPIPDLDLRMGALVAAENLERERRGKKYDLRPLVLELERLPEDENGQARIRALLSAQEGATGRPEEVILALGGDPALTRVERTRLEFGYVIGIVNPGLLSS